MSEEQGFFLSIATLIDDFKSSSVSARLNSMQSLKSIASALGPARTRQELLPYVNECIEDSDDVLCVLAEELGTFLEHVGGLENVPILLRMLETLCSAEDLAIRDKAAASLNSLATTIYKSTLTQVHSEYYSLVCRMSRSDYTGSRATSCSLIAQLLTAFSHLGKTKTIKEILSMYATLAKDGEPQVRRGVALALPSVVAALRPVTVADSAALIAEFLHPILQIIAQDTQDGVRLLAYDIAITLGNPKVSNDIVLTLSESSAWRVRYMAAFKLGALAGATHQSTHIAIITKLLSDPEAEVRATAVCQLCQVRDLPPNILTKYFHTIINDTSPYVRSAMVGLLGELATMVPTSDLKDIVKPLLSVPAQPQDLDSTMLLVKQLTCLAKVAITIPLGFQSVIPLLNHFSSDTRWRVRQTFAAAIPGLFGVVEKEHVEAVAGILAPGLVTDKVQAVRITATVTLGKVVAHLGIDWARRVAVPILSEKLVKSPNYLLRVTGAHACRDILLYGPAIPDVVLPLLRTLSSDTVPNVRVGVAEALGQFIKNKVLDDTRCTPILTQLASDKDDDVSKAAKRAQGSGRN